MPSGLNKQLDGRRNLVEQLQILLEGGGVRPAVNL